DAEADTVKKYDVAGRLVETIDGVGNITQYKHDNLNRVVQTRVLAALASASDRQSLDPISVSAMPAYLATTAYDENGNAVSSVVYDVTAFTATGTQLNALLANPKGFYDGQAQSSRYQETRTEFDSLNRPVRATFVGGRVGGGDVSTRTIF